MEMSFETSSHLALSGRDLSSIHVAREKDCADFLARLKKQL